MIFSKQHNCVIYQANPAPICALLPDARALSAHHVAVPVDLRSFQVLRLLGMPVPNLLDLDYDWPMLAGRKPYEHQKYMAAFHALHPRSFNLSEMGTGKTLATLWAADYLMRAGVIRKALILSPLSTLKRVWDDEIFRNFTGRRSAGVLYGDRDARLAGLRKDHDFYIINHDGLGVGSKKGHRGLDLGPVAREIQSRGDIDLVVVDEASAYKDSTALRTRILRQVIADKPYVWQLSGTPTPNAPTDAYSLARIAGNLQNESLRSFQARTMFQITQFKWVPKTQASEIVKQALTPAVRFSREECIDLPECVVETRDVELSLTQDKAYKELKRDLQVQLKTGQVTAMNEAGLRIKLLQICSGAVYGPNQEIHRTDAAPRLSVLKEIIDEAGAKIIVFASFTSVVDMITSQLRDAYGSDAVAKIYGDTGQAARSEIFRRFESEASPKIIVADPGTMSHGLTLVAANTIVWWSPTDRLETYQQANARINRPGQKNRMLIARLAGTPIELEIYKRLEEKSSLQGVILKLAEEGR